MLFDKFKNNGLNEMKHKLKMLLAIAIALFLLVIYVRNREISEIQRGGIRNALETEKWRDKESEYG